MRIITGRYKGRIIKVPKGIRPTEDRVRKAFFDILGDVSGMSFLELFAGSGAMGFEALSRGAKRVVFVEKDSDAVKAIEKNLSALANLKAHIIRKDALAAIAFFTKNREKFDLIFLDPPYYRGISEKTLQRLAECDILSLSGFAVIQHFKNDRLPKQQGQLVLFKQSQYGDTLLSFYRKVEHS